MSLTHFLLKHFSAYNSFDAQEHKPNMSCTFKLSGSTLMGYLFNGHTASHVCLTQLC